MRVSRVFVLPDSTDEPIRRPQRCVYDDFDVIVDRGREEQSLFVPRDAVRSMIEDHKYPLDVSLEAHVEQTVGLVEDKHSNTSADMS